MNFDTSENDGPFAAREQCGRFVGGFGNGQRVAAVFGEMEGM